MKTILTLALFIVLGTGVGAGFAWQIDPDKATLFMSEEELAAKHTRELLSHLMLWQRILTIVLSLII